MKWIRWKERGWERDIRVISGFVCYVRIDFENLGFLKF